MTTFSQPEGELVQWRTSVRVGGEDVPGLFFVPLDLEERTPLVLIQHPATGSKEDYFVADVARLWAGRGWICGGFDAPYHGERMTHDPLAILRDRQRFPAVAERFCRELSAVADDLLRRFPVDPARMAFVGYSMGALLGLHAVAADGRFRAAVFCQVGEGGLVGAANEPGGPVQRLGRVAVRVVGKAQDELVPRAATEALFDALPGEKDLTWLPGGHFEIGPDVAAAALDWLTSHL